MLIVKKEAFNDHENETRTLNTVIDKAEFEITKSEKFHINEAFELEEIDLSDDCNESVDLAELSESNLDTDSETVMELDPSSSQPQKSRGPKWKSPVWNWFSLDPEDLTNAICQVAGCSYPFVSRGNMRKAGKQGLTTSMMRKHLFNHHGQKV